MLAVRGYEDPTEPGERLADITRVVPVAGVRIGMVHDIQWPATGITTSPDGAALRFSEGRIGDILTRKFGQPVDLVVFGDTHEELICYYDGVLLINPGSPTYPGLKHQPGSLGTIGLLEIRKGVMDVQLVRLAGWRK